jgi:hypothetical protein
VCRQLLACALKLKKGDREAAERLARANYRTYYGEWPSEDLRSIEPEPPLPVVENKMKQQMIAYAHRRRT